MVMIMPIVFTFMFLRMPAGLVLYWVVNSLTTIGIQRILSFQNAHQPPPVAS
jgi:membrane protein insertase Oxa1/YidC/SpoIIIJ